MKTLKIFLQVVKWSLYWYPFKIIVQANSLPANYKLANLSLPILFPFFRNDRKKIERGLFMMHNAGRVIGEEKVIVRNTFRNILHSALEVLWYPKLSKKACNELFTIIGKENIDRGVASGKGTVLLHGHFGNPHLIMPAIGHAGYKLSQVASRVPPERFPGVFGSILYKIRCNAFEEKLRYKETLPVDFIYTDRSIREIFRRLQKNEVVAIGMDGREGTNGIEFDFIGGRAIFYTGAMRILRKARPVILPVFHIRKSDDTHMIVIEEPFDLEITDDEEKDVVNNTRKYLKILESYILKYPDHYARVFCLKPPFFVS